MFKRIQFKRILLMYKMGNADPFRGDKIEHVSMQVIIRYASKQCINTYQIHSWPTLSVLMTFEARNL